MPTKTATRKDASRFKAKGPANKMSNAASLKAIKTTPEETLLQYVTQGMTKFKERLSADVKAMLNPDRPTPDLVQLYVAMRAMSECIDDAVKPISDAVSALGGEIIPAAFERDNVTTLTTDNGFRVTVSSRLMASILKENRDAAFGWMRANGMGDLIQPTVNAGTLSAEAKQLLEQGKELPESLFSTFYKPTTSLTKVKAK